MPRAKTKTGSFRLTPAAKQSLVQIGSYTQEHWGAAQRDEYLRALDQCFRNLTRHPRKGQTRDELAPGLRSYPCGKHIVYYLLREKILVIVDVLHERMDPFLHLVP